MTAASQSGRRLTCLGWTPRDTVSLATVGHGGAINTGHPLPTRTNRQDELTSSRAAPELREAADAILRSFSAGGGEMSGGSNLLTISRSHSAAAFSTTKASAEAPAARPEGDDARAAPKRDPARMKQMAGPASAFLLNKWLHAGVLLVLFLASGPRTVRYACNAAPDACLWMPPSVSGFTFMPVNDNHLLVDGTPVVFDGFLAQYRCTKNASRKGHHPTMLFRSPKLALSVGSVQTNPSTGTRLDLLVGILSGCSSSGLRSAVRQTWQRFRTPGLQWRAVFIVGNCTDLLVEEQEKYGDLLFTTPNETYYALTAKVLDFFVYASTINPRFVMKTDDDTFVFIDRILTELKGMRPTCLYWGSHEMGKLPYFSEVYGKGNHDSLPLHVLAVPTVKWYIPEKDFKLIEGSHYMAGGAYIMSPDLVQKIVAANVGVPSHLPEDATMGSLLGKDVVEGCMCADSRHVKDVDDFQNLRLLTTSSHQHPEALPCEISNVVHRTLTIHGLRNPQLHHDILGYAIRPRDVCNRTGTGSSKGIVIKSKNNYWESVWGRPLKGRGGGGHTIYMHADSYNSMVGCSSCKKDRPVAYGKLLSKVKSIRAHLNPWGFDRAHYQMHASNAVPNVMNLTPMRQLLHPAVGIPWCVRVDWASKLADMLLDLDQNRLLLCDLQMKRIYVNTTAYKPVISAGRSQYTYGYRKFHSGAWCFTDEQCHSCFKSSRNENMDWLPEAKCDRETNRCPGYDANSQATALVRKVLWPMLFLNETNKGESGRKILSLFKSVTSQKRTLDSVVPKSSQTVALSKGLQNIRGTQALRKCVKANGERMKQLVDRVRQGRWETVKINPWGVPTDLE